ncbi:MAG: hypothetical protein H0W44_03285 [Gammaproteobacteria bacterium]|nr:hypothetical protein [Gammaproteobacteria bacterium]
MKKAVNWVIGISLILAVVIVCGYLLAKQGPGIGRYGETHQQVIMYSTTSCEPCMIKRHELAQEGIPYIEYAMDREPERRDEMHAKLTAAGFPQQTYGTPIMDVHGVMMPNNPSIATVKRYMQE